MAGGKGEPWFKIGEAHGLRFLKEQLLGLDAVRALASRASVLDLGCAEGLVGKYLIDTHGADLLQGVEYLPERVEEAQRQCAGYINAQFFQADLNDLKAVEKAMGEMLLPGYGVVLLLAILHKLREPEHLLKWAADHCIGVMAVRYPGAVPEFTLKHAKRTCAPDKMLRGWGWKPIAEMPGPRNELTITYRAP